MTVTPEFGGATFDAARDAADFRSQLDKVRSKLLGGGWLTLAQLAEAGGCSEAAASARVRDLRKSQFGAYTIEKRVKAGTKRLYEYHLGACTDPLPDFAHGKTRSESA